MKTIAINQFGTADEFHEINLDQPALTADTVAVAIHAFSINPMDIAARAGYLQSPFSDNWSFPLVLGWDFSGIITEVGQNVTQYHAGDHVFGTLASDHPVTRAVTPRQRSWIQLPLPRFLPGCHLTRRPHCQLPRRLLPGHRPEFKGSIKRHGTRSGRCWGCWSVCGADCEGVGCKSHHHCQSSAY
ncbi:alcohol dehydrogenase catalytic domain-containing protein [Secundilactobacillus paracollinoides]|uniref:alcohol dehydrogenase catalytic domain-containing protein n=1 Tax=Secundilactobacillus paracollinoides TaxID=240427 RepID=UPI000B1056E5|nr:alcohol dehydrogenase catalytic domain-containing protein [Secundilactobacillus paracollinoides]